MTFPAYPAYKESGVKWLPEVPEHWDVRRNKQAFRIVSTLVGSKSKDFQLLSLTLRGVIPRDMESGKGKFPAEFDTYQTVEPGDIVFCLFDIDETPRTVGISSDYGMITGAYTVARAFTAADPRFIYYYYFAIDLRKGLRPFYTGLRKVVRPETFMNIELSLPPRNEQANICNFLDHETARIDALIEEQQRLIELLKEKRQALISHAVTKGLDPTVPLKDSGVEWLGEVPAHWKVSKLGHYAQILTGFPFPSASFSHDESDVRLLRGANIGVGSLKWIDTVYWNLGEGDSLSSYLMGEGQIVLGMDRPWISEGMRIARVTQEDMPCLLLQRVAAITPSAELDDEYLFCLLASELFKTYVEPDLTGVSVPHISPEQIMSFQISVPEIDEQRRISSFIRNQLDQMSALFQQASESVELLQERRSALISAAVTGKIDVRGWQPPSSAPIPELIPELVEEAV